MSPYEVTGVGLAGALALQGCKLAIELAKRHKSKQELPPPKVEQESFSEKEYTLHRKIDHMAALVQELHVWHNQKDEDGVLKWLNKPSVEREIKRIGHAVDDLKRAANR